MTVNAQFPREQTSDGSFNRQDDAFREWVSARGDSQYPAEAGRYHLYVSLACPWACRTIIVRKLKGLEGTIGMTIVDPIRDRRGWHFTSQEPDPVNGWTFLSEAYVVSDPGYSARVTVPVLWDKQRQRIVSNSDDDIMRMFESEFDAFAANPQLDIYPCEQRTDIDRLNDLIYETFNNGVYRAGFATTQAAYERAAIGVFETLDAMETRLNRRYLFGDRPLESDWRFFVTLVRFDPVYYGHFKCNLRRIVDYPNLYGYLRDLYQIDRIAETVNFDHIKRHYYITQGEINPTRIVPIGPEMDLNASHGRERLHQ